MDGNFDGAQTMQLSTGSCAARRITRNTATRSTSAGTPQTSHNLPSVVNTVGSKKRRKKTATKTRRPYKKLQQSSNELDYKSNEFTVFQIVDVSSPTFAAQDVEQIECQDPLADLRTDVLEAVQEPRMTHQPKESSTDFIDNSSLHVDDISELKQDQWLVHKVVAIRDGKEIRIVKEFQTKQAYVEYIDSFPGKDLHLQHIVSSRSIFCDFSDGQESVKSILPKDTTNGCTGNLSSSQEGKKQDTSFDNVDALMIQSPIGEYSKTASPTGPASYLTSDSSSNFKVVPFFTSLPIGTRSSTAHHVGSISSSLTASTARNLRPRLSTEYCDTTESEYATMCSWKIKPCYVSLSKSNLCIRSNRTLEAPALTTTSSISNQFQFKVSSLPTFSLLETPTEGHSVDINDDSNDSSAISLTASISDMLDDI